MAGKAKGLKVTYEGLRPEESFYTRGGRGRQLNSEIYLVLNVKSIIIWILQVICKERFGAEAIEGKKHEALGIITEYQHWH